MSGGGGEGPKLETRIREAVDPSKAKEDGGAPPQPPPAASAQNRERPASGPEDVATDDEPGKTRSPERPGPKDPYISGAEGALGPTDAQGGSVPRKSSRPRPHPLEDPDDAYGAGEPASRIEK